DIGDEEERNISAIGNELLADNDDAINLVEDHNTAQQFGVMDLGDEAEADDVDSGEYGSDGDTSSDPVVEDVGDDPAQTEEEIAAEIVLLTIFFNTFRWEDQVLAGNLKNDILREMSATGWEDVEEPDI
ncbi:hypothetical protein L915_21273, partial [Phytophthora nicotianae]